MLWAVFTYKVTRTVFPIIGQETGQTIMVLFSLHLDHKVAMARVDIFGVENTAIGLEPAFSFMPTILVKVIEVISPMELKLIQSLIPGEYFNEVVGDEPWHIFGIESVTPSMVDRCPEVHPQGLGFVDILNSINA